MKIIDRSLVLSIKYEDDPNNFDERLYTLGKDSSEFLIINPEIDNFWLQYLNLKIPSEKCILYKHEDTWIAKKFSKGWDSSKGWLFIEVDLTTILDKKYLKKNPNLPDIFDIPNGKIDILDFKYELVWYLNNDFCESTKDRIWVYKYKLNDKIVGTKDMGTVNPVINLSFERNKALPDIFPEPKKYFDIFDYNYEQVWYLDPELNPTSHKIWVYKFKAHDNTIGIKEMGFIKPVFQERIIVNPSLPPLFPHVKITINNIFDYNYKYEHIWYFKHNNSNIWVYRQKFLKDTIGVKDNGFIDPVLPPRLDVFFLSYNEPNAEENYQRLKSLVPDAKRVNGVEGILNAHIEAAKQSETDMFYVVDADAWVLDDFDFKFQPDIFDRDATFIWFSQNPFTKDIYGNGGIKLLNRNSILNFRFNQQLDFATSFTHKLKIVPEIGSINKFASDNFHAYKGAFRETIKLLSQQGDQESEFRLERWKTITPTNEISHWIKNGVDDAIEYYSNSDKLDNINNNKFVKNRFNNLNDKTI